MQEKVEAKVWYSLYGRLLEEERLRAAFAKVRIAKGAAGIDGQSIASFAEAQDQEIALLLQELKEKSYRPLPVRRVVIPKPDGGERKLGIPAVRDRVVQQALLGILQPVFEPHFHPSSYAYRPGRSCHDAIAKVAMFTRKYDLSWVVDLDLSKCFDTLDHDLILQAFRKRVTDGSLLNLLTLFLKSGVMVGGSWQASEVGSPQGGVISPLVANVYLHEFDMEMMRRGHRIVRYADDILVLKASKSGAENALEQARSILEGRLKLKVNEAKTAIRTRGKGIPYLGVVIRTSSVSIQRGALDGFKTKVKAITRRNSPVNLEKVIRDLNPVTRGFANYFKVANCKRQFEDLNQWTKRRLRAKQMKLWKKPLRMHRRLRQLGFKGDFKFIEMGTWKNARSPLVHYAIPNKELLRLGFFELDSVETGILSRFVPGQL
jgi:RNA-directed DNA polymerase